MQLSLEILANKKLKPAAIWVKPAGIESDRGAWEPPLVPLLALSARIPCVLVFIDANRLDNST